MSSNNVTFSTPPSPALTVDGEDNVENNIAFHCADGEVMKLCENGDIFVNGELAENNKQVVEGMKYFLKKTGVYSDVEANFSKAAHKLVKIKHILDEPYELPHEIVEKISRAREELGDEEIDLAQLADCKSRLEELFEEFYGWGLEANMPPGCKEGYIKLLNKMSDLIGDTEEL